MLDKNNQMIWTVQTGNSELDRMGEFDFLAGHFYDYGHSSSLFDLVVPLSWGVAQQLLIDWKETSVTLHPYMCPLDQRQVSSLLKVNCL